MVEYLGEIADEWDEISAKNQTDLLENLFGKRGASVGTAILGNFDAVEEAISKMETAAGSADSEMDTIRDSISYKWNAFVQTWIGYLEELLNRGDLGELVDNLTEFAESFGDAIDGISPILKVALFTINSLVGTVGKLVDAFGPLSPWLTTGAIVAYKNIAKIKGAFSGIESVVVADTKAVAGFTKQLNTVGFDQAFANNLKGANVKTLESAKMNATNSYQVAAIEEEIAARQRLDAQKQQSVAVNAELTASETSYTGAQLTASAATVTGSNAAGEALINKIGLTEADFTEGEVLGTTVAQKIADAEATGALSIAEGNLLAQTIGLNTAQTTYQTGATLLNATELSRLATSTKMSKQQLVEKLNTTDLALEEGKLVVASEGLNAEQFKQIVNSSNLSKKNKALALSFTGVEAAETSASVAGKIFSGVLNTIKAHPIMAAISAIVMAVEIIPKIYEHFHTSAEDITEAADTAKDKIDELKSSLESAADTTKNVASSFADLAQQVGNLGKLNQNQGSLDTDDYEQFLDYSNQLAELYPSLVVGYDDAGNAILNLNGNAQEIVNTLNDLLEVQEEITRTQIVNQIPDVWKGYAQSVDEYTEKLTENQQNLENLKKTYETLEEYIDADHSFDLNSKENSKEIEVLEQTLDKLGKSDLYKDDGYEWIDGVGYALTKFDLSGLSDSELDLIKNNIAQLVNEAESGISTVKNDMDTASSSMTSYIQNWLDGQWSYTSLSDDLKQVVNTTLSSSDWLESLPSDIDKSDWASVSAYLKTNLLDTLAQVSPDVQDEISQMFTGELSITGLNELLAVLQGQGFDENNPLYLYIKTKVDEANEEESGVVDYFTNQTGNDGNTIKKVYENASAEEQAAMQTETFKRIVENDEHNDGSSYVYSESEIQAMVDQTLKQIEATKAKESAAYKDSFSDVWDGLTDTVRDKLLDLAKSGEITKSALESTDDYAGLLEAVGGDADAAKDAIYSMLTPIEKLGAASKRMKDISDAYTEWQSDGIITADTMQDLKEGVWGELDSWDSFESIMGDPTKAAKDGQDAIDKIVSEYLESMNVLDGVTEDTKDSVVANLKQIGIGNAEEYVQDYIDSLEDAQDALEQFKANNILDFGNRPVISSDKMQNAGYDVEDGSIATYYSSTYGSEEEGGYVLMTPILPDGTVLSQEDLDKYASDALAGNGDVKIDGTNFTVENITIGSFDTESAADAYAETIHEISGAIEDNTPVTEGQNAAFLEQNAQLDENTSKQIANKIASYDASTATYTETQSLADETSQLLEAANASDIAKTACFALVSQEKILSNTDLDFNDKIEDLYELALAYGIAADSASAAATNMRLEDMLKNGKIGDGTNGTVTWEQAQQDELNSNYNYILGQINDSSTAAKYSGANNYTPKSTDTSSGSEAKDATEFDWIEVKLDSLQDKVDKLDSAVSRTWSTWSDRNKSLRKELSALGNQYDGQIKAAKKYEAYAKKVSVKSTSDDKKSTKKQEKAFQKYKKIIDAGGTYKISEIKDEDVANAVQKYQDLIDKAKDARNSSVDTLDSIMEKHLEEFENVCSEYEGKLELLSSQNDVTSTKTSGLSSALGTDETAAYYSTQNSFERSNISTYQSELTEQESKKKKYERAWKKRYGSLDGIEDSEDYQSILKEIYTTQNNLAESNNNIIQNTCSIFDARTAEIQTRIDRLADIAEDTWRSWDTRSEALSNKRSESQNLYDTYGSQSNYWLNKMNEAESTAKAAGVSSSDIAAIKDGAGDTVDSSVYKGDALTAFSDLQNYYNKYTATTDAQEEQLDNIMQSFIDEFDNAVSRFEAYRSVNEAQASYYDATIKSSVEANGGKLTSSEAQQYYNLLNGLELKNQETYKSQIEQMQTAMNEFLAKGGSVDSEDYLKMQADVINAQTNMQQSVNNIAQNLYQIATTKFEELQETVDDIETQIANRGFIVDVMESLGSLVQEDGAGFTDRGIASLYEYQQSINDAKTEYNKLEVKRKQVEEEYAAGHIGEDEAKKQLKDIDSQEQQTVKDQISAQDSIKQLFSDMYSELMDHLNDLISIANEQLQTEKDAYDYQKSIQEKSDNISSIQKQLVAYSGDNSEENIARMQQLNANLSDAKDDLYETEWDRYISETNNTLSDISEDMQDCIDDELDNISGLLDKMNTILTNSNQDSILKTNDDDLKNYGLDGDAKDQTTGASTIDNELDKVDQSAAQAVIDSINAIGTVSSDSATSITNARSKYDALTDTQKAMVDSNGATTTLTNAETELGDITNANNAVGLINAIGTVAYSDDSKSKISAARSAYDALSDNAKSKISSDNLGTLTNAESRYASLENNSKVNAVRNQLVSYIKEADEIISNNTFPYKNIPKTAAENEDLKTKISNVYGNLTALTTQLQTLGVASDDSQISAVNGLTQKLVNISARHTTNGETLQEGDWVYFDKNTPLYTSEDNKTPIKASDKAHGAMLISKTSGKKNNLRFMLDNGDPYYVHKDKLKYYATGSKSIDEDQMAWTQEKGQELIFRKSDGAMLTPLGAGDAVFTAEQTSALWNLSKGMLPGFATGVAPQVNVPASTYSGGNVNLTFDGGISMHGVNDPQAFAQSLANALNNDKSIQNIIATNTLGKALGKNSLNGRKYM